ncbi:MAG: gfo/Idh/MocA family oxidoreductase [Candidatus Eisenbacteria bacterium]|nr:gfo/Idh/MocA family oxidoreductase [Candidatus Eisenbacteria bacterium]
MSRQDPLPRAACAGCVVAAREPLGARRNGRAVTGTQFAFLWRLRDRTRTSRLAAGLCRCTRSAGILRSGFAPGRPPRHNTGALTTEGWNSVVKLALIGAGAWGQNLLRNLVHLRNADLVLCCDTDGGKCANAAAEHKALRVCGDPDEVIESPEVEAVVIATPASSHYELAVRAMEAGKDVFVEKPMTLSLDNARKLVDLADRESRVLMVGHLLEYHPAVEKMKELLDAGEIGEPYYLYSERVNLGRIRTDENALWSFAPHDISIILYLLNQEPVEVAARGAAYIQPDIEDVAFLWMQFPGNRLAQVHVSWLDPHKVRRTTLVGSKKMIVFDDMQAAEKIRIYNKGVEYNGQFAGYAEALSLRFGEVTVPVLKMREPLRIECEHFADCVAKRATPRSDGRDGLRVVRVLDAAQRSLKAGGAPVGLE